MFREIKHDIKQLRRRVVTVAVVGGPPTVKPGICDQFTPYHPNFIKFSKGDRKIELTFLVTVPLRQSAPGVLLPRHSPGHCPWTPLGALVRVSGPYQKRLVSLDWSPALKNLSHYNPDIP